MLYLRTSSSILGINSEIRKGFEMTPSCRGNEHITVSNDIIGSQSQINKSVKKDAKNELTTPAAFAFSTCSGRA